MEVRLGGTKRLLGTPQVPRFPKGPGLKHDEFPGLVAPGMGFPGATVFVYLSADPPL
ncbi:hypothetical protein HMPREF0580_2029 [Mobiluncus mulieris ATCC 35239]|uniref:Uncharacterized protein n=1 Tax=Mobiluncus mulieris ATCC 35239 TaxID=871571 RepID=E0QT01_9ACTO|nr:hypothetical protein [Mobiluncus mulieris]EFM45340.1 hypothetical protein HMPREF0580_2029 [Mobiluncus mulieris ATCC 35239]NMW81728.1 hypothetical protein [Mobiluncus mulieris]